jgi:hypothetical protein
MLCAKFLQASYIGEKKILRDDSLVYLNIRLTIENFRKQKKRLAFANR